MRTRVVDVVLLSVAPMVMISAIAVGCGGGSSGGSSGSETFESPSEAGGSVDLTISEQEHTVGGLRVQSLVYNGDYAAPVLKIRPGSTINLRLRNLAMHQPSNVHTHGMNVSPKGNSDNIFVQVEPENCFDYSIKVSEDQDYGLNWYHSHMMGLSETQVFNGLSGGLLVEGIGSALPFLKGMKERIMILKDIQAEPNGTVTTPDYSKPTVRTINGVYQPTISIRPGETQFWRVGNMGANLFYQLSIDGHQMVEIVRDGNIRTTPLHHNSLILPPGARTEFLITGGAPGTYKFRTLKVNTGPDGDPTPEEVLATVVVEGSAATPVNPPAQLASRPDLRQSALTGTRRIVFSENNDAGQFFINGKLYSPSRDDVSVPLGSVEKWELVNNSRELHTFHIHTTDFQVVAKNGAPVSFAGYQDTVDIDVNGSTTIIVPFTKRSQIGRFVFHCHILEHEDGGMMQNIVVYDPADPSSVGDDRMLQGKPCG
jgi:suppressor of ftsI